MFQLNDVLSLCVGLWAVRVANQETNSKMYTYGVSGIYRQGGAITNIL
jgi:zinc transporter 1